MQRWGHLIANHGYAHKYGNSVTEGQLAPDVYRNDILAGAKWLQDNGFERGARIWAIAGGGGSVFRWDHREKNMLNDVADLVRDTFGQPYAEVRYDHPWYNRYVVPKRWTDLLAGITTLNGDLDAAKLTHNPLIVTGWHGYYVADSVTAVIDSNGALTAEWKAHIDLVASQKAAGRLVDITLDQLIGEYIKASRIGSYGGSSAYGN
jgi:peptidoglycan/xylan/chitin deacetylase (PgdA/CDA1 family)